jgi:hypothetical protein
MKTKNEAMNNYPGKASLSGRGLMIVAIALALICVTMLIFLKYPPKLGVRKPSLVQAGASDAGKPATEQPQAASGEVPHPSPSAPGQAAAPNPDASGKAEKPATVKKESKPKPEKVFQDPVSRVALSLVGLDSDAEDYWLGAVFDPNLPKSERQDLIDDLNEEGLPDPKHPTEDDLPVLYSRLDMLEELIPFIHGSLEWEEAREDLINLIHLATDDGGRPVD